jgi:GNAT superfamily N-acetyltransferase
MLSIAPRPGIESVLMKHILVLGLVLLLGCGKQEEATQTAVPTTPTIPAKTEVPVTMPMEVRSGRFFKFAVPAGWRVQEEGQFAVVLVAPDNGALTVMTGNTGLPANYPPGQFLQDKLRQLQVQNVRTGPASMARPMAGCSTAWQVDYTYSVNGVPCRGVAKVSVAPTYDMCSMVVTLAASQEVQWAGYASWLPEAAEQVAALNGAAFGARGVMQQNLANSVNLGEQARRNREWSAATWADVNKGKAESQDRNNAQFREALGNVQSYTNPYDAAKVVELPTTFTNYWVNRQGRIVGTNDPSEDPNRGSTEQWSRMAPQRR